MSTIRLTLPDGSVREMPSGATARQLAEAIGPGLARAALAAKVDGAVWDLDRPIERDARVAILTERDPEALEVLRHSSAHILATAVRELFPGAGIGFGPPIEDGFYYDFDVPRPFTPEDLERIEQRMGEVARRDDPFVREVVDRAEANRRFADDPLKLERIAELGDDETISVYTDGPFQDLCRGPHVPSTGRLKHFKLLHAAGAYWRGDERRQMLQRIYGTAWFTRQDLEAYLHRLEEARKRDHRVLGKQLDLFSISEVVGPGLVLWHPKGATLKWLLSRAVEDDNVASGYDLVYTPNITREELFRISGHIPLYADNQYPPMAAGAGESEEVRYRVKPMNCPMHALIYKSQQRSYRDLPIRLSEVANVYRNERSGVLHGLLRVRGLSMDDAHIFCTMDQVEDEIFLCLDQVARLVQATFGFELDFEISTRPPERLGSDEVWDRAEAMLARALDRKGIPYRIDAGGGAFYGPKIDIKFRDAIGRLWQGPTIQLDFNLPERFELEYTGADNKPHRPVMIHRAIYGTLERFTGLLIEHFAGAFPVWLAPEQVRVIPISDAQTESARALAARLKGAGLRVHVDDRSETLNYRIREGELQKVPYMAVIGQREAEAGTLALRVRGAGKKQEVIGVDDFLARIVREVDTRALAPGQSAPAAGDARPAGPELEPAAARGG
ncbi:MAG TPA: threonine--tRNA ligase [Gemmatimonadales bacterium]|nr:threonine--tRNA ligase [Gemmatimonadales bacterium]